MFKSLEARTVRDAFTKLFRIAFCVFPLLLCARVATATVEGASGTITTFRLYTVQDPTSSTHDYAAFQLSPAMGNGCTWAWVDPTDQKALAVVLAAKATSASVTINFENTSYPPWGDTSMCALQLITLN